MMARGYQSLGAATVASLQERAAAPVADLGGSHKDAQGPGRRTCPPSTRGQLNPTLLPPEGNRPSRGMICMASGAQTNDKSGHV